MPTFTNESEVRQKFQLTDTTLVPSSLVAAAIDDAHAELLRFLDSDTVTEPPEDALVMGETLLAGAHLYRSLASKAAFDQKRLGIGSTKLEESSRFQSLMAVAEAAEEQAWYTLEPYLEAPPPRTVGDVTDTETVLGED